MIYETKETVTLKPVKDFTFEVTNYEGSTKQSDRVFIADAGEPIHLTCSDYISGDIKVVSVENGDILVEVPVFLTTAEGDILRRKENFKECDAKINERYFITPMEDEPGYYRLQNKNGEGLIVKRVEFQSTSGRIFTYREMFDNHFKYIPLQLLQRVGDTYVFELPPFKFCNKAKTAGESFVPDIKPGIYKTSSALVGSSVMIKSIETLEGYVIKNIYAWENDEYKECRPEYLVNSLIEVLYQDIEVCIIHNVCVHNHKTEAPIDMATIETFKSVYAIPSMVDAICVANIVLRGIKDTSAQGIKGWTNDYLFNAIHSPKNDTYAQVRLAYVFYTLFTEDMAKLLVNRHDLSEIVDSITYDAQSKKCLPMIKADRTLHCCL